MNANAGRIDSNPMGGSQHPTFPSSAAQAGETTSEYVTRILDVSDNDVREKLITEAFVRLANAPRYERKFWAGVAEALIDGRTEEVKERRHAEFMARNAR